MPIPITPIYARGDLAEMLAAEEQQIEETVADMTEEQMAWRPAPSAKSALDILWHLAYDDKRRPGRPKNKAEALAALRQAHDELRQDIAMPGKLDERVTWWTGEAIPYRGVVLGAIRHRAYHLGELVYLRQAQGLDRPIYYHEANSAPLQVALPGDEQTLAMIQPSPTVRGSRLLDWRWRNAEAARALLAHVAQTAGPTVDVMLPAGDPRAKDLKALGVVRRPANGAILAFSRTELRSDSGWISWMGVVPEARRRGLARALLAATMAELVTLGRNVLEAESTVGTDSHRFWSHVSFQDGPQRVSYKWVGDRSISYRSAGTINANSATPSNAANAA